MKKQALLVSLRGTGEFIVRVGVDCTVRSIIMMLVSYLSKPELKQLQHELEGEDLYVPLHLRFFSNGAAVANDCPVASLLLLYVYFILFFPLLSLCHFLWIFVFIHLAQQ
jgi:hypothetical protein